MQEMSVPILFFFVDLGGGREGREGNEVREGGAGRGGGTGDCGEPWGVEGPQTKN